MPMKLLGVHSSEWLTSNQLKSFATLGQTNHSRSDYGSRLVRDHTHHVCEC